MRPCENCRTSVAVAVEMRAGRDGRPWWLCVRCYIDGLHPMNVNPPAPDLPVATRKGRSRPPSTSTGDKTKPSPKGHRFTGETGTYVPDGEGYW